MRQAVVRELGGELAADAAGEPMTVRRLVAVARVMMAADRDDLRAGG